MADRWTDDSVLAEMTPEPDQYAVDVAVEVAFGLCRSRAGGLAVLLALARPERASADTLRAF